MILATDGTPLPFRMNIMYGPAGATFGLEGSVTWRSPPLSEKESERKRWPWLNPWVTAPSLTNVTLLIDAASGVLTATVWPQVPVTGAEVIAGRGAGSPAGVNRYGGE